MLETSAGQVEYRQSIFGKEVAAKICQHSEEQKIVEVILVKKQKGKSRATHVAGDMRKRRLRSLFRVCVVAAHTLFILLFKWIVYHRCGNDETEGTDCLVPVTSTEDI